MSTISVSSITRWATSVLESAGLAEDDAASVASNLAYAETRGTTSHGFIRLAIYLERIASGGINPRHSPRILWDLGALAAIDADAGPGAATAIRALSECAERASKFGIGGILVSNANHFGAAAYYAEMLADRGFVGIVTCNTDKAVCAPLGGKAVLGTNPLAIALPVGIEARPVLDMATSEVAYGKLLLAEARGESIPLGWAFDAQGQPTTSPTEGLHGAMTPAAGPKGFGLAFMIDSMLALGGAKTSPHVNVLHGDPSLPQQLGQMFIAMDASKVADAFDTSITDLIGEVRSSNLPGSPEPLFPGEPEATRRAQGNGVIVMGEELMRSVDSISTQYGVPL